MITRIELVFDTLVRWGLGTTWTWHDLDLGRPIAAPLERCAELLGVELATVRALAATVEPYLRADGTRIWNLMQLERHLIFATHGAARHSTTPAAPSRSCWTSSLVSRPAHETWPPRNAPTPSRVVETDVKVSAAQAGLPPPTKTPLHYRDAF